MGRLDGKVAIITGSAGGIGAAAARLMAREGAKVVIADLNENGAKATAEAINKSGGKAIGVGFNQGDEASIKNLIDATVSAFGAIHVLLNNAANLRYATGGTDRDVLHTDASVWSDSFKVNVEGVFLVTKYALPHLLKTGNGSIINIGSASGNTGELALSAYGTTKSAVIGFSRYVAVQYGKQGVRCNSISPGVILTDASKTVFPQEIQDITVKNVSLTRLGQPEDIGNLALFLASDESSFITGQDLKCDGGYYIAPPQTAELRDYIARQSHL